MNTYNYLVLLRRKGERLDCASIEHTQAAANARARKLYDENCHDRRLIAIRVEKWAVGQDLPEQMSETDIAELHATWGSSAKL